jgi:hypothetical protein
MMIVNIDRYILLFNIFFILPDGHQQEGESESCSRLHIASQATRKFPKHALASHKRNKLILNNYNVHK